MVLPKYDEPYIIDAKTWSPPARARARGPRRGLGRRRHRQRALCARMALAPFDTTKWKSRQCGVTQPGVSGADSRPDHRYIDFFLAAADKREEALVGALQARQAQVAHLEKAARDRDRRFIELERRLSIAGSSNKAELPANKQVSKAWEVAVLSGMIGEGVDDGRFDQSLTLLPPDKLEAVVRQTLTTASRPKLATALSDGVACKLTDPAWFEGLDRFAEPVGRPNKIRYRMVYTHTFSTSHPAAPSCRIRHVFGVYLAGGETLPVELLPPQPTPADGFLRGSHLQGLGWGS